MSAERTSLPGAPVPGTRAARPPPRRLLQRLDHPVAVGVDDGLDLSLRALGRIVERDEVPAPSVTCRFWHGGEPVVSGSSPRTPRYPCERTHGRAAGRRTRVRARGQLSPAQVLRAVSRSPGSARAKRSISLELLAVAPRPPALVVEVLAPAGGVGAYCLDVAERMGTDPDVLQAGGTASSRIRSGTSVVPDATPSSRRYSRSLAGRGVVIPGFGAIASAQAWHCTGAGTRPGARPTPGRTGAARAGADDASGSFAAVMATMADLDERTLLPQAPGRCPRTAAPRTVQTASCSASIAARDATPSIRSRGAARQDVLDVPGRRREGVKDLLLNDDRGIYFTTRTSTACPAVLMRIPDLGPVSSATSCTKSSSSRPGSR